MNLIDFPSLQKSPIEASAGHFEPTITVWDAAAKSIDLLKIEATAINAIATAATVIAACLVTTANFFITAPAKLFQVSSINNTLDDIVRYAIDGTDALVKRSKRMNLNALEAFTNSEVEKIKNTIYQPNNAFGSATPNQLVSSEQVIFDGMSQIMQLPQEYWSDLLRKIYEENSEIIQLGIEEIDSTLKNSKKIEEQVMKYESFLDEKISRHNKIERKRSELYRKLENLKNQPISIFGPNNTQNEINRLERRISVLSKELDNVLSENDTKAIFSSFYKNYYLRCAIKDNLKKRKAFLESIKFQESGLYVENPPSWTKTVLKACSVLGVVASGYYMGSYIKDNGIPTKDELSKMANDVYSFVKENAKLENITWDNISNVSSRAFSSLSENINSLWNNLTRDNILSFFDETKSSVSEGATQFWNSLTTENISSVYSQTTDKISEFIASFTDDKVAPGDNTIAGDGSTADAVIVDTNAPAANATEIATPN